MNAPKNGGRPTKRTPDVEARIVEAIEKGCTRVAAAQAAGVSRDTLHSWAVQFPDFSDALTRADGEFVRRSVATINAAGTWQATAWLLERRVPADFGRRSRVEAEIKPVTEFSGVDERIEALLVEREARHLDPPEAYSSDTAEGSFPDV